jgi:vesicle-fusing ATPase
MEKNNLIGSDVKNPELARITNNYTGAEIEAVVKSAASWSFKRGTNILDF